MITTSVPRVVPMIDLRQRTGNIMKMVMEGPVVVTHRSRPRFVVSDYEAYLEELKRVGELEQLVSELQETPTTEE